MNLPRHLPTVGVLPEGMLRLSAVEVLGHSAHDPVRGCRVSEDTHRSGSASDLLERSLQDVGGSDGLQ